MWIAGNSASERLYPRDPRLGVGSTTPARCQSPTPDSTNNTTTGASGHLFGGIGLLVVRNCELRQALDRRRHIHEQFGHGPGTAPCPAATLMEAGSKTPAPGRVSITGHSTFIEQLGSLAGVGGGGDARGGAIE